MGQIDFYQIDQAGLETVLLQLIKKTLEAKKKALILCPMPAAIKIDDVLWTHEPELWIPHGINDGKGAEHCNVWISSDMSANRISAEYLFLLHGSTPAQWSTFTRSFYLFDGKSTTQLQRARDQWKEWHLLPDNQLRYFTQNVSGGWNKKA